MALRKTYYPSRIFDDDLDAFARLAQSKGWEFPAGAIEQIVVDAEAQRTERADHDALRSQFLALHENFGLAQLARYRRFMALVKAARGMFCEDKAVIAELDRFSRGGSRRSKKVPIEGKEAA
jgi:hypothetical protein